MENGKFNTGNGMWSMENIEQRIKCDMESGCWSMKFVKKEKENGVCKMNKGV